MHRQSWSLAPLCLYFLHIQLWVFVRGDRSGVCMCVRKPNQPVMLNA